MTFDTFCVAFCWPWYDSQHTDQCKWL